MCSRTASHKPAGGREERLFLEDLILHLMEGSSGLESQEKYAQRAGDSCNATEVTSGKEGGDQDHDVGGREGKGGREHGYSWKGKKEI